VLIPVPDKQIEPSLPEIQKKACSACRETRGKHEQSGRSALRVTRETNGKLNVVAEYTASAIYTQRGAMWRGGDL